MSIIPSPEYFAYRNSELFVEDIAVKDLADRYGTPCYIYSHHAILDRFFAFEKALNPLPHLICYAVKANSNLAILRLLSHAGAGFDVVSRGELARVLKSTGSVKKTVFSGVGKTMQELEDALSQGVYCIQVESHAELQRLEAIAAALHKRVPIALRVNPNVDPKTHPYIATGLKEHKFGIDKEEAEYLYLNQRAYLSLDFIGVACHIGSQVTELSPFMEALDHLLTLADLLAEKNLPLQHIDLGGGLGVRYQGETPPIPEDLGQAIRDKIGTRPLKIILEPGRSMVAHAGIAVTRVEYLKKTRSKEFAIVDLGMNDFLRPALYQAKHAILPVTQKSTLEEKAYELVGPVCESSDVLGHASLAIENNDLLAVEGVGAYGFSMSSNYNARPRAAEILVEGSAAYLIRRRETLDDLMQCELPIPIKGSD